MTRRHGVLGGPKQQLPIRPRKESKVNTEDEPKSNKSDVVEIITVEDISSKLKSEKPKDTIDLLEPINTVHKVLFETMAELKISTEKETVDSVVPVQSVLFSTLQIPEEIVDIKKEEKPKKKKRKYKRKNKSTAASEQE